jgi:hypothetical protein
MYENKYKTELDSSSSSDSDSDSDSDNEFPINSKLNKIVIQINNKDYVHEIFKHLDTNDSFLFEKSAVLVVYNINVEGRFPFIQFMFQKTNNLLSFPTIQLTNKIKKDVALKIGSSESNLKCKGYTTYSGTHYLFINISDISCVVPTKFIKRAHKFWFCVMDEIINYRKACNFYISIDSIQFLLSNPDLFLLKNAVNGTNYEMPIVAYSGSTFHQAELDGMFGPSRKSELSLFGSNYYFTTYEKAIESSSVKGGINRYVLFEGNIKIIYKPLTNYKINDEFDSIYVGKIQVNENVFNSSPMWVVKYADQIVSLSYHEVGDKLNNDYNHYFIS